MIGTGIDSDSFRVNAPTWRLVHVDYDARYMIVDVPDDVHGLTEKDLGHESLSAHETGDHYAVLCDTCTGKVHDYFDTNYKERKGEFRLEFA